MSKNGEQARTCEIIDLVDEIKPLMSGRHPKVQAGALAELLSLWLAGHWIPGQKEETTHLRDSLLTMHVEFVRSLTELNSKELGTDQ